ncbi:hypothetical protein H632_c4714p0, partial [Helicosporidium sp. ATCC 50920]
GAVARALKNAMEGVAALKDAASAEAEALLAHFIRHCCGAQGMARLDKEYAAEARHGALALYDVLSPDQLQHLHLQLGSDRTGAARAELARLKTTYEHRFKFTGKV